MSDRLCLALSRGVVALPEGDILILHPGPDTDLSCFDRDRTVVFARSASAQQRAVAEGWKTDMPEEPCAAVIVALPRAREAARAAMRHARHLTGGPIIVDGNKTDGVDSFYREVKERAEVSDAWSKAHGKVFTVAGGIFDDWPSLDPVVGSDGWWRAPGVFSADGVDKASAYLAENLPGTLAGTVVDLGAGWGYLARAILDRAEVEVVHLVEDDVLALRSAEKNVTDGRARFHAADAKSWRPDAAVDHVVTNPPFHVGRAAEPELGRAFIRSAADMLKPKGSLWLVANRHLPYETTLEDCFRSVETLAQNPSFKIFHATSPKPTRKG